MTTEEFFESCEATRFLITNLKTNLKVMGHRMTEKEQVAFMRMNLIMIKQCLQDCGYSPRPATTSSGGQK